MTIQLDDVVLNDEFLERFWSKVDASGDCWLWTAGTSVSGYGRIMLPRPAARRGRMAHRIAWRLLVGPHCIRGHLFDDANTYWKSGKYRTCRTCKREYMAVYHRTVTKAKRQSYDH